MTTMSDLPRDLVVRILSRVPLTCMRRVRFTCKKWNSISKDPRFVKMHIDNAARQLIIMMSEHRLWLMSVNLHGYEDEDQLEGIGKLTSLTNNNNSDDQVEISKVFHSNGLLLVLPTDKTRLVSNSWRVLDGITPDDWEVNPYKRGVSVSLKGDTYFFAKEKLVEDAQGYVNLGDVQDFLICFDFTSERFGPRLPLPFHSYPDDTVTLSSVREEQLAVYYLRDTWTMEIWVTDKIEPNVVSWNKKVFLAVDLEPLVGPIHQFAYQGGLFFIDEEKKIAVVFDKDQYLINDRAYLIGGNGGYYKEVDLGYLNGHNGIQQVEDVMPPDDDDDVIAPLGCSYSPSSVKIQHGIGARGKRKERD
ncbi:PREDICTED: putative F-box protein At4g09790 [Camelina sativa]|uniref:F-box protein At4g09790 n=1 Tax=Camelina sativa TaxID=90675 RepID=A0ABM0WAU9_CAMSA|nr:PREDICTED: putative F-box protein At4g09790 [Camelina sativa]